MCHIRFNPEHATEHDKISGKSKQTWRKVHQQNLNESVSGVKKQNQTDRLHHVQERGDRFRVRCRPQVSEHHENHLEHE